MPTDYLLNVTESSVGSSNTQEISQLSTAISTILNHQSRQVCTSYFDNLHPRLYVLLPTNKESTGLNNSANEEMMMDSIKQERILIRSQLLSAVAWRINEENDLEGNRKRKKTCFL